MRSSCVDDVATFHHPVFQPIGRIRSLPFRQAGRSRFDLDVRTKRRRCRSCGKLRGISIEPPPALPRSGRRMRMSMIARSGRCSCTNLAKRGRRITGPAEATSKDLLAQEAGDPFAQREHSSSATTTRVRFTRGHLKPGPVRWTRAPRGVNGLTVEVPGRPPPTSTCAARVSNARCGGRCRCRDLRRRCGGQKRPIVLEAATVDARALRTGNRAITCCALKTGRASGSGEPWRSRPRVRSRRARPTGRPARVRDSESARTVGVPIAVSGREVWGPMNWRARRAGRC